MIYMFTLIVFANNYDEHLAYFSFILCHAKGPWLRNNKRALRSDGVSALDNVWLVHNTVHWYWQVNGVVDTVYNAEIVATFSGL